ncbi:MAG TPA: hypothetical protein VF144_12775 [Chitinophagaceae bacterium]
MKNRFIHHLQLLKADKKAKEDELKIVFTAELFKTYNAKKEELKEELKKGDEVKKGA